MERRDSILSGLRIDNLIGLEIGPLDKALIARNTGVNIFYADYTDRETLVEKSSGDTSVNTDNIPYIDYIISPLPESLDQKFDYIIASHVIEHVPDLIGWLKALAGWLNPGGRVIIAAPDRQYMFDRFRPATTAGDLLEAFLTKRERPPISSIYDGFRQAIHGDAWYLWEKIECPVHFENLYTKQQAFELAKTAHTTGIYRDCHCWVFSSYEFRDLLDEMREIGVIEFEWEKFSHTEQYKVEFFATLRFGGQAMSVTPETPF